MGFFHLAKKFISTHEAPHFGKGRNPLSGRGRVAHAIKVRIPYSAIDVNY